MHLFITQRIYKYDISYIIHYRSKITENPDAFNYIALNDVIHFICEKLN